MASTGLRRPNDPPLLILVSLAGGPKHGHALAKDIEGFAGVRLGPGALYGAITRLVGRVSVRRGCCCLSSGRPHRIAAPGARRARGGQVAMVARDVVLAFVALTGALILASALVALPALVRFLRAGGWREIRRRVGWAAGASVLAGSAPAGLALLVRSRPFAQLDGSCTYLAFLRRAKR